MNVYFTKSLVAALPPVGFALGQAMTMLTNHNVVGQHQIVRIGAEG